MPKRVNEDGQVWAVPVGDLGYCPAVVARSADPSDPVGFSLVYVWPGVSPDPFAPGEVPPLPDWGDAWVGLVARRPFSTQRWTLAGSLPSFDPDDWPVPPWQEPGPPAYDRTDGWSVATTADAATMTVLTNDAEPASVLDQFPHWSIVTAPSRLESSLEKYLQSNLPYFGEMHVNTVSVDADVVRRWVDYANSARASVNATEPDALPAGRKTDRFLAGGEWLAFPARGGGFSVARLVFRPPKRFRARADGLVMVFDRVWPRWPTLAEARELTINDAVAMGQTSMICVRDGRWRVLGREYPVDTDRWPLPLPWQFRDGDLTVAHVRLPEQELAVDVDPDIVGDDPRNWAGWTGRSSMYWSWETYAGGFATDFMVKGHAVTPERVAIWRHINEQVQAKLDTPLVDHWIETQ